MLKTPSKKSRGGRKSPYPWEKWFSKKSFNLTRGTDFTSQVYCMRQLIYEKAQIHRKVVSCYQSEDGNTLHVTVSEAAKK